MKILATSAVAAAVALGSISFGSVSAHADRVVVKKETTYKTTNRPAGVGVVVSPGIAVAPGLAVVPTYRNDNCKKTVTKVNRPGNRPDTKTVKTTC